MMIAIIFLIVLSVAIYLDYASKKCRRNAVRKFKGPFNFPLLGAVTMFNKLDPKNFFKVAVEFRLAYGRIVRIWAFNRLMISSSDLELNEQLLASQQHIVKQRNYKMLHPWLGVGLLLSDGRKWFARRKIITPAFHFKVLEQFVEVFDQQSNVMLDRLAKSADGRSTFDVYPFVCLAALDIIAETAMGTKVDAQGDARSPYAIAVNRMTKLMAWRFMKLHLNSEIIFSIMHPQLKLRQTQLITTMHAFTTKVIEERRQNLERALAQNPTIEAEDILGAKKRMALLDVLLQSTIDGKPLSNEDIREEVDTFMFEGHDTTTSAISFMLHLLSRHAGVQEKLRIETEQVLGNDRTQPIMLHALNELKYMECVIKETLRMYPSVPVIGRQIDQDFHYKHSKYGDGVIPAGSEFFVNLHSMMNDSDLFENPETFSPERHEDKELISAFSLIPFSAGPRNCIGQKFAMLEIKTMIAKVVRDYELLPFGEAVQPELNIVMRSSNGFQLGMRRR